MAELKVAWNEIKFRAHVIARLKELGRLNGDGDAYKEPARECFHDLTREELAKGYQIGKCTIREVEIWLGRELPRVRSVVPMFSPATIERAINLLEKHGYVVNRIDNG